MPSARRESLSLNTVSAFSVGPPRSYSFFANSKLHKALLFLPTPLPPLRILPLDGVKSRHTLPGNKERKSYVCRMVENESFHLWRMNTSDLANVSPRGQVAHTNSQTGFSRQKKKPVPCRSGRLNSQPGRRCLCSLEAKGRQSRQAGTKR